MTDPTLGWLTAEAEAFLQPLLAIADESAFAETLLAQAGWVGFDDAAAELGDAIGDAGAAARTVLAIITDLASGNEVSASDFQHLGEAFAELAETLGSKASTPLADLLPVPLPDLGQVLGELAEDLVSYLVCNYLIVNHPAAYVGLVALSLIDPLAPSRAALDASTTGTGIRREGVGRHQVRLDRLGPLVSNPAAHLRAALFDAQPGTPLTERNLQAFSERVLGEAASVMNLTMTGIRYGLETGPGPATAADAQMTLAEFAEFRRNLAAARRMLMVQTIIPAEDGTAIELELSTGLRLGAEPADPAELLLRVDGTGQIAIAFGSWTLALQLAAGPGAWAITSQGVAPATTAGPALTGAATVTRPATEAGPIVLGAEGVLVHIAGVELGGRLAGSTTKVEVGAYLDILGAKLVISAGRDGFLNRILPADGVEVPFEFGLEFTSPDQVRIRGKASLEADLPIGLDLGGVIQIPILRLRVLSSDTGLQVTAGATIRTQFGPLFAEVSGLGMGVFVDAHGPALMPVPPTGIGLAIDTPAVSGAGFLDFYAGAGRYAGVFELTIVNTVSVKVIGIITTKLADGRPGFALLLLITAEGFTPVQLGMGFVLTGIGGLIALNRTIDVEAVRGGLRSGVLDSVLFAKDPVANADQIITTLDTIFPLAPDRLLIGPLAEISWGSPPVVKVRLALLMEIPQPVRVVLLAALALALPDEDSPVVELHVDAIGVLDLGRGELALDASLHHSRLWKFALTGDLALRLNWGDHPTFVLSVGGFHPAFTPPAGLRRLDRLTFSLSDGGNPRIRFETYLAVTSNTIQLGARVSVLFTSRGFGVEGGGAFDALVQWVPFGFDVRFEAWIRIFSPAGTLCAARLALQVTGPQPWHVVGVATLHVLMFKVKVGVDFHIGDPLKPVAVEVVDVVELLWGELTRPGSWATALPPGSTSGATLGGTAADAVTGQPRLVHPLSTLSVRQKVVPLGTLVTRIGALRPKGGPRTYHLDVESPTGIAATPLWDRFAAAQFTDLNEDEKLSAPAFVSWAAGLSFVPAGDGLPAGRAVTSDVVFETLDVTSLAEPAMPSGRSSPGIAEEMPAPTGPASWAGLTVVHQ